MGVYSTKMANVRAPVRREDVRMSALSFGILKGVQEMRQAQERQDAVDYINKAKERLLIHTPLPPVVIEQVEPAE